MDTHLLNGFHRYLLTGEDNLCAKDGQNLLGIKQRSKEGSMQTESFSKLSRFSWRLKGISSFQFLNQNRFCLKRKVNNLVLHVSTTMYLFHGLIC